MDPGNFLQYMHVDDHILSGDDRLVRDMVQKLKWKFPVKKVELLTKKLARQSTPWVEKWHEQSWGADSPRRVGPLIIACRT